MQHCLFFHPVARTSTGGKPTEMGVRYLSKNDAIEWLMADFGAYRTLAN